MKTALDTGVLLEVFEGRGAGAPRSARALKAAYAEGPLVVCDVVMAEVRARFADEEGFQEAVRTLGIRLDPVEAETASLAGRILRDRKGRKGSLDDCLVAAHAFRQADRLLTRRGEALRRLCPRLRILAP